MRKSLLAIDLVEDFSCLIASRLRVVVVGLRVELPRLRLVHLLLWVVLRLLLRLLVVSIVIVVVVGILLLRMVLLTVISLIVSSMLLLLSIVIIIILRLRVPLLSLWLPVLLLWIPLIIWLELQCRLRLPLPPVSLHLTLGIFAIILIPVVMRLLHHLSSLLVLPQLSEAFIFIGALW